jgi:hypothetical protein
LVVAAARVVVLVVAAARVVVLAVAGTWMVVVVVVVSMVPVALAGALTEPLSAALPSLPPSPAVADAAAETETSEGGGLVAFFSRYRS